MSRKWFQRANDVSRMNQDVATQAEAEAGTDNEKVMTPLRVTQAAAGGGMSGLLLVNDGEVSIQMDNVSAGKTGKFTIDLDGISVYVDGNLELMITPDFVSMRELQFFLVPSSTLPSANTRRGSMIATTNGGTGGIPALMWSNGSAWVVAAE